MSVRATRLFCPPDNCWSSLVSDATPVNDTCRVEGVAGRGPASGEGRDRVREGGDEGGEEKEAREEEGRGGKRNEGGRLR